MPSSLAVVWLLWTVFVTALLVGFAFSITSLLMSKGKKSVRDGTPNNILAEYGRAWCLHQIIPFMNVFVGFGYAMDNRMIAPLSHGLSLDWYVRLPLVVLCGLWPSPLFLFVAHMVNIVSWAIWMPAVWDHMCWAALLEILFVCSYIFSMGSAELLPGNFFPSARALLIVLYYSAAWWKLTTSWYDSFTSCAPVLLSELLSEFPFPPNSLITNTLLRISPVVVAAVEFAVPTALLLHPRAGILLALIFHQTINLMPSTYAGGFSIAMCTRMTLFVPGVLSHGIGSGGSPPPSPSFFLPTAITVAIAGLMMKVHRGLDAAGFFFLILATLYMRGIQLRCPLPEISWKATRTRKWLCIGAVIVGVAYGFLGPMAGVQAMASSTMYGNVRQFGNSNHLFTSTGLLQEYYSDAISGSWASDAFGGGLIRVDDTTSVTMLALSPGDGNQVLNDNARALLKGIGAAGVYYELYAQRNYFDRRHVLLSTALHRGEEISNKDHPPYVIPAYELRRVLAIARSRGESFRLVYTKVPYDASIPEFLSFRGVQVVLEEDGIEKRRTCVVGNKVCEADEIALLPPPPGWLSKILLPYPIPLLYNTTEVYCST
eukprot:TRINITY_DN13561_c0_g1_i2.p1 TRINITY_DN13561_c0_g1~~TRINITY_DN13561_c0_g1_i2.p1  ORF type:complete len:600 (-),score=68.91 TRINITY_DN13561_c0_g1_i2:21-1820(-)